MVHIVISEYCMYGPYCDIRVLYVWSILWYQSTVNVWSTLWYQSTIRMVHIVISELCMYGPHCDVRVLYVWSTLWYKSNCMYGPHCDIIVLYVWSTLWYQSTVCLVHIVISECCMYGPHCDIIANQKAWLSKLWNQSEQQTITIFQFRIRGCIRFCCCCIPIWRTRGPKGHISCTWVQYATFLRNWPGRPSCFSNRP